MQKTITFRIDSATRGILEDLAFDTGRSQSEIIRQAIDEFIMPLHFRRMRTRHDRDAWLARRPGNNWKPRFTRRGGAPDSTR